MKNLKLNKSVNFVLAKNQINRNKLDNKAKSYNKNLDFMPLIQNNINGHIEWEWQGQGITMLSSVLKGDIAVEVSIKTMNSFVEIRKFLFSNLQLF